MTRLSLSERDRRAVGAGIALLFAIAGLPLFTRARAWQATAVAAVESAMHAGGLTRDSTASAELADSARVRAKRLAAIDDSLVAGATADVIAATVAEELERIADSTEVAASTVQVQSSRSIATHATVLVRVNASADVSRLFAFLRALDASATRLAVRELSIASIDAGQRPDSTALRCEFVIESIGVLRRPKANPNQPSHGRVASSSIATVR